MTPNILGSLYIGGNDMLNADNTPDFVITPALAARIDEVLEKHNHDFTQVVGVLLDTQDLIENNYIPQPVAFYIAQKLPVPVAVIYDCLNFYSALSTEPRAKHPIQVCRSIVCHINDNDKTLEYLKELLGIDIGEVTGDGRFSLEAVTCFGACDVAPAVRIDGVVYGHLDTKEKIAGVLRQFA